jgi:predicted amidohydrolase YtcJ
VTSVLRPGLIVEGRIATLAGADGYGWAEALAIGGGRILAAGSAADIRSLKTGRTAHWRLTDDVAVMPGITDAHLHLLTICASERDIDLEDCGSLADMLERLGEAHMERVVEGDVDGWLLGHGWTLDRLGTWPDAVSLDAVTGVRPVALYSHDHHSRWLNTAALTAAGIVASMPDPANGLIRRDSAGRPSGILHEAACSLVDGSIPSLSSADIEQALAKVAARLVALGITGVHDPGELGDRPDIERGPLFYRDLAARGRLPLRVHSSVRAPQLDAAVEAGLRSGEGMGRFRMGWLKLFADGSLGSRSAALLEPYTDAAVRPPTGGATGMLTMQFEEMVELLARAAGAGIAGQVHAIGDAAVRVALRALSGIRPLPVSKRIEHAQLVDPVDAPTFGALGIAASVQPVHLRSDAAAALAAWGQRTEHAFPLADLIAGGAAIPFGTDAPVEPPDPWPGIAMAVSRRDTLQPHNRKLGPRQAISLVRAVRAACLDPAEVAAQPELGRLIPGCRADLIVVPATALRAGDPQSLAATRPLAVLIDGQIVHEAPTFDP